MKVDISQQGGDNSSLRSTNLCIMNQIPIKNATFQPLPDELQNPSIINPLGDKTQEVIMVDVVEETLDICIKDIVISCIHRDTDFLKGIMGTPIRSEPITAIKKISLEYRFDHILRGSLDNTVGIWDTATGLPMMEPLECIGDARCVAFSPDGRYVAAANTGRCVRVCDVESGDSALAPLRHPGGVWHVAYSPDGRRLVGTDTGKTARIWDTATGHRVATLEVGAGCGTSVCC